MFEDVGADVNLTLTSDLARLDANGGNATGNGTQDHVNALDPDSSTSIDALLYIVVVLLFYAFSIVVLMVKYVRREKEEAGLRLYYYEFVERDKFRSARFQNQESLNRLLLKFEKRHAEEHASVESEGVEFVVERTKLETTV